MKVKIYSGGHLIEVVEVKSEAQLHKVVDYWISNGYRVRVS